MTLRRVVKRERNGGFTLVEVLAAFVILALFTVAIQRNVVSAAWSTARADARVAGEAVAATLLESPPAGSSSAAIPTSGTLNGFAWTLRVEPLPPSQFGAEGPLAGEGAEWVLVRVTADVRSADSRRAVAHAEIIRMVRAAP